MIHRTVTLSSNIEIVYVKKKKQLQNCCNLELDICFGQDQMAIVGISDAVYATTAGSGAIITTIVTLLILIHHCYKVNQNVRARKIKLSNSIVFSIILPVTIVIQTGIFETWTYRIKIRTEIPCKIVIIYGNVCLYILSEWALYMLLSFRIGM